MATVEKYETGSGATRYCVRYRTPDRRQTRKRGFTTKRDAEAWANQLEVDKRRGAYVAPAAGRTSLGDYAQEWLDSKHKLKASTRARYQVAIDTHLSRYSKMAIGDITKAFVREWAADLNATMAPASVHKIFTVLRQVLAMAVEENKLVANPAEHVELPTVDELEMRFLTLEQLHALADAAGDNRALVYVLGTCGLRFGEVAELRWKDVDLDKLTIRVARSVALVNNKFEEGPPKNGKARTVSLSAFVADLLDAGDKDALVFPDSAGGRMRGTNVRRRWWAQAVARTGLEANFKLHELRHTAASLAITAGANIKALQNMLGHKHASLTLDRYGHLYPSDVDAVGVAMNGLLTRDCVQNVATGPSESDSPVLQNAV